MGTFKDKHIDTLRQKFDDSSHDDEESFAPFNEIYQRVVLATDKKVIAKESYDKACAELSAAQASAREFLNEDK